MPIPIATSAITEGMILAESILNKQGQVLLPGGSPLKERHILMLKTWGIAGVVIQGGENDADADADREPEYSEEVLALARTRVEQHWAWKPRNALENELYRLAVRRAAELTVKGK